jgi:hypothetical protein
VANARVIVADVAFADVSNGCAELLAWLLPGGSTRFGCRNSGEDDAWSAWARVGNAVVGACWRVRSCRTSVLHQVFTSGFVSSSYTQWYVKKHVLRTLIFEFGSNTLFFKNKL